MENLQGSTRSPPVILLTGATGFLGGAVACELLRRANAELLFIARARAEEDALRRLRRNLAKFGLDPADLARISDENIVCGTLGEPALFENPRVRCATHIVNCAALVSFAWNREVWRINVDETEAFGTRAAILPNLERFVHVSTALVSGATRDRVVTEPEFPADARQLTLYTKSKAETERRLRALLGDALTIVRPSVIVGHTDFGCGPSGSIFWLFRMIHAARRVPFMPARRIDVVPVDYCAKAIAALLLKRDLAHDCYHVSAGDRGSCSFADIDRGFFRARGEPVDTNLATFDIDTVAQLTPDFERWFGCGDSRQAATAIRVYAAFAGLNVTFDNARLLAEGVASPPRFCDYLEACVRSVGNESIFEQMTRDMR